MKIDPSRNIPTASSESQEWIQWHKDLKKIFGKKKANSIWTYAWSKRGGVDAKANSLNLSNYMEKQGVDIDRTTVAEIGEFLDDARKGFMSTGKWILIIGGGIVAIILLKILTDLIKDPNKSVGQAMMFHPATRGAKGLRK